jgi:protein TonB
MSREFTAFLLMSLLVAGAASAQTGKFAVATQPHDAMPMGPSVADRLEIIRDRIQRGLVYPPLARLRESDGDAVVRFEIDHSGAARDIQVVESSGYPQLDASAIAAVESAAQLPWVYGPLEIPVRFNLVPAH